MKRMLAVLLRGMLQATAGIAMAPSLPMTIFLSCAVTSAFMTASALDETFDSASSSPARATSAGFAAATIARFWLSASAFHKPP